MKQLQLFSAILIGLLTLTLSSNSWANPECANYDVGMKWITTLDGAYTSEPHVAVVGNLAYLSLGSVYVVDLADPENPEIIDQLSSQRLRGRLDANETLLVVGGGHSIPNIEIHSLGDPRQPEFLINFEMPDDVMDVCCLRGWYL